MEILENKIFTIPANSKILMNYIIFTYLRFGSTRKKHRPSDIRSKIRKQVSNKNDILLSSKW
jgi:hypothetical protein